MATLILAIVFAVFVAISAFFGLIRGMNKAIVRLITLVIAAAITFFVAGPITNLVAENIIIEGKTLGELLVESISSEEFIANILEAAPLMEEAILVLPVFAMSIVVFPVTFLLLKFLTWIIFCFVQKPLRKLIFKERFRTRAEKKAKVKLPKASFGIRALKRLAGVGVGAVTGALIFGMIMAPAFAIVTVLPEKSAIDQVLDSMVSEDFTQEDADLIKAEYGVTESAIVKIYGIIGLTPATRAYLNSVSRIEADGQVTSIPDEVDTLFAVFQTAVEGGLLDALNDPEDTNALFRAFENQEFVDALMQDMFNSKLLRSAIPEVMAFAMESVAMSMNVPADKEAVYDNMMDDIAGAVKDADIDYDAIKAYEATKGRSYIDADDDGVMTEEEYKAQIDKLIALTEKIAAIIGKTVAGSSEDVAKNIADSIVRDVKDQASENGANIIDNFNADAVKDTISSIAASNADAGAADMLGKLTDPEKFETNLPTVETIKASIRETVMSAVADDSKSKETASTLASVISNFAGAVSAATDADGNLDATKLDFNKIATAIDDLQKSTLKGVGSSVLDIVASSDALAGNEMISGAIDAIKEGYNNDEPVSGAIGSAGALIGLAGAMNGEGGADDAAAVKSIENLIQNLNDFTIQLLPKILSNDTLIDMGVPAEYAEPTYKVFETLLIELKALQGSENYDSEVDSILALYKFATKGDIEDDEVNEMLDYAFASTAVYNTINSIGDSNPFGIELTEEERVDFIEDIEESFAERGKKEEERDFYLAVARMFGLEKDVDLK